MSTQTPPSTAAGPLMSVPSVGIDAPKAHLDPTLQIGRSGLKQYGGFLFEEFLQTLRGKKGAEAYREVLDNSPLVGGIMRLLELTMRKVNKYVTPFSEDAEDVKRAERIEQGLDDMSNSWADTLAEITSMLPYGYAPMEIVWKNCQGWSDDGTTRSRYDDGLVMPRKIYLMAQDTLFRWEFDDDGGVRAFVQLPPPDFHIRVVPIEKMLLFRPHVAKGNPEGTSILRSGYFSWVMIKRLIEFEGISGERDATGIPIARIPGVNMLSGATPEQKATFAQFKKLVQNLRIDDQHGTVIPSDMWPGTPHPMFSVELIGSTGRAQHFDFGAAITRHEVRLAMSMLADIMMLGHDKVGSFALSKDKKTMLADALGAWLDSIVGVFNRHLFPRMYAYNGWPMDRMCTLGHGEVKVDDLAAMADALLKLSQSGMPLWPDLQLENHIREEAGWPERSEDAEGSTGTSEDYDPNDDLVEPDPKDKPGPAAARAPKKPAGQAERKKFRHQPRSARRGTYSPTRGDVTTAIALLADRARVGSFGDSINHGFLVADPAPYDPVKVDRRAIDSAAMQRVQLKDLVATQQSVRRDTVRSFLENPGMVAPGQRTFLGNLEDRAVIVRSGGKQYIQDGHHRLAARALLGQEDAIARVIDIDG